MNTWKDYILYNRVDGSYVITYNKYPYHVTNEVEEYKELWQEVDAYAKLHPEQVQPEPEYKEPELSLDEKKQIIRNERNRRISETDYLLMVDYPISESNLLQVKTYRQNLRDLPSQEGFPWNGDIDQVPWPIKPSFIK